jgi:hypothetical protein
LSIWNSFNDDEIVVGLKNGRIIIYLSDGTLKQTQDAIDYVDKVTLFPNDDIVSASDNNAVRIWTNLYTKTKF